MSDTPAPAPSSTPASPVTGVPLSAAPAKTNGNPPAPAPTAPAAATPVPAKAPAPATPVPAPTPAPTEGKAPKKAVAEDPADSSGADNPNGEELEPIVAKRHLLPISLGLLSLGLVAAIVWMSFVVHTRNTSIMENQNRLAQLQFETDQLLKQVEKDKGEIAKVKQEAKLVDADAAMDRTALDKTKAETAALQIEAEKLREKTTDFETRMTQAQVTSIKHQGEVEIAEAKTKVALTQLNKALNDTQQLQAQLVAAKIEQAETQLKLDGTEKQLALLQKPKGK